MTQTLQVRIDSKTKNAAARIFTSLGLDMSTGIKIYLHQVLKHKGIPFQILTENGYTPKFKKGIKTQMKQTEKLIKAGKLKTYKSWREMEKSMTAEK